MDGLARIVTVGGSVYWMPRSSIAYTKMTTETHNTTGEFKVRIFIKTVVGDELLVEEYPGIFSSDERLQAIEKAKSKLYEINMEIYS